MKDLYAEFRIGGAAELRPMAQRVPSAHGPTLIGLLAQTAALDDTAKIAGVEMYRGALASRGYHEHLQAGAELVEAVGLAAPERVDLSPLPANSFYLRLDFSLETAYISRDDWAWSVTENPVRKDRVFEIPFISPSTWKGALRNACRGECEKEQWERIFGYAPEDGEEDPARAGRVRPYPSFFSEIGLEMINPHDRVKRIGKNPIGMECVPVGATSRLGILYAPLTGKSGEQGVKEAHADLRAIAGGCRLMLRDFGFAAKKSSGYGAAKERLTSAGGLIQMRGPGRDARFQDLTEIEKAVGAVTRSTGAAWVD